MSKYIDLAPTIKRDRAKGPITGLDGESYALTWLDSHPDQVPGRTITRSDYQKLMDDTSMPYGVAFTDGLHQAGGSIIPDQEPTNAEKLAGILQVAMQEDGWGDEGEANILAAALEAAGVKAPGGDDE